MLGAMYSGITGMHAAAMGLDVIGNNVANVSTAAFKSGEISFASMYSDSVSIFGGSSGNEKGQGVQVVGLGSVWEQGALESTMNNTDLAISGDGFFKVIETTTSEEYFTRAGQFSFDESSNLTDPEGRIVQGYACTITTSVATNVAVQTANVDITVDTTNYDDIMIASDGYVTGVANSTATGVTTGDRVNMFQISLFDFPSINGLRKVTGSLYQRSDDSGDPLIDVGVVPGSNGLGKVNNNHLEMSNVDLATEFVDLIVTQKAFQANSRVISSSASMLDEVINIVR